MPESPELVWTGRLWLFLPQVLALVAAQFSHQALFLSQYLSYTTLGGAILLAYWATRDPSRDVRLGLSLALAVTLFLWSFTPPGWHSRGLYSSSSTRETVEHLRSLDEQGRWLPGDVVLLRPNFPEADLLPDRLGQQAPDAPRREEDPGVIEDEPGDDIAQQQSNLLAGGHGGMRPLGAEGRE